ncbi:hypothetical protein K1719_022795 [Acacia pycnantha]|nr:hypothetical protein K1719_022795 [Acacia pycnantha]
MIIHNERVVYVTPLGNIPRITVVECVIGVCLTVMLGLLQLPYEYIGEDPVPTIVFRGRPHTFHTFVLFVLAAFMTATRAIHAPPNSSGKFESYCVLVSVVSISSAFLVFSWALLCSVIF